MPKQNIIKEKITDPPINITRILDNTPSKAFDYANANERQKMAITATDGPVLITAGPGTGKTFTLVQRALYLIQEKGIKPEEILMATFTEKAAKELITRISNTLIKKNILLNLNEMYIGTFHSIALRFIKENLEYSKIRKNYRTLDDFDQKYIIMRQMHKFKSIENFDLVIESDIGIWKKSKKICEYVNNLAEELVEPNDLKNDKRPHIRVLGEIMETYNNILENENLMDFSRLQTEAYSLIRDNPLILEKLQAKIKYLMIDEYQDTNYIQERLIFLLGRQTGNICVVGDDDQSLYRFRGATVRNILEFPGRFTKGQCVQIPLDINYRSNSDIVDFYNRWMNNPSEFEWDIYRYDKTIKPKYGNIPDCPAVLKVSGGSSEDKWHKNILAFINELRNQSKVTDLNQIAFLFRSAKSKKAVSLARYLEENGVSVYSPRSNLFFDRDEVKLVLGLLLFLFPQYVDKMENNKFNYMDPELEEYYRDCIVTINTLLVADKEKYRDILSWVKTFGKRHQTMSSTVDYSYAGLLYRMFEFDPFKSLLATNISFSKVMDLRIPRNLALLSQIIIKFEYLHQINVLTPNNIEDGTERFFNQYLRFLYKGGINEYEDDSEYAPSGCVSFLTIHQAKGMEFPVVMAGSLSSQARNNFNDLIFEVETDYFQRPSFEPRDRIKYFDLWRLYYTAFSRAQNLLALISPETQGDPNKYFRNQFNALPSVFADNVNLSKLDLKKIKDVNVKESYSFTSDISVYETCGMQYKFFKVLEFAPIRLGSTLYGKLVHQTIEDIHKTAIRGEKDHINENSITSWFETNYSSLSRAEHTYLAEPQLKAALKSVLRYAERHRDKWEAVVEAEVGVSLVKEDYIIEGKIDLIRSPSASQDIVEIIDFKSEKKPDLEREAEKIDRYKKQLQVYAHLIEQNTGKKVSKLHLRLCQKH
jgi:DNA helicase-2/ATP-dependent DNA helicase PcrA